ncbi:hypothetical protein N0V88_005316 [Collariella sp. IMI 366227]|nr:hypothetical protein N0V88_005316 [Collariella sp. IMI 366227]
MAHSAVAELHTRVDMVHMELLHHYMTHDYVYPLMNSGMRELIITTALQEPYVMHSTLALSAHHFSISQPERQSFYHDLAIQLQTRALTLFNTTDVSLLGDSAEKRIPLFIFSALVGFHALCDALMHRDNDYESAMARFMDYIRLHRGIHAVMDGCWEALKQTRLKFIFDELVPQWFRIESDGHDCDDIRERIASLKLEDEEYQGLKKAIDLVQWVLGAKPDPESRAYVLVSWTPMLARPYVAMLEAGRPEALAVLAYYFLALHHCRSVWMIGGAGQHLLTLMADHFRGGEWYSWVEVPYRELQRSLEAEATKEKDQPMADANTSAPHPGPDSHSEQAR